MERKVWVLSLYVSVRLCCSNKQPPNLGGWKQWNVFLTHERSLVLVSRGLFSTESLRDPGWCRRCHFAMLPSQDSRREESTAKCGFCNKMISPGNYTSHVCSVHWPEWVTWHLLILRRPSGNLLTNTPWIACLPFSGSLPHSLLPDAPWDHFPNKLYAPELLVVLESASGRAQMKTPPLFIIN